MRQIFPRVAVMTRDSLPVDGEHATADTSSVRVGFVSETGRLGVIVGEGAGDVCVGVALGVILGVLVLCAVLVGFIPAWLYQAHPYPTTAVVAANSNVIRMLAARPRGLY
jgi:hypothetical protein